LLPIARRLAAGWIAGLLIRRRGNFRFAGQPGRERRIYRTAVKFGEAEVAVETNALLENFADCRIQWLLQRRLLHNQLPDGGG
jgi:hypothetical protein